MNDDQFRDILNQELAKFAGPIMQHVDTQADVLRTDLKSDIAKVYGNVDSLAKRLTDDEAERAAMNAQLDRHERWHHQAADTLHLNLDY